MLAGFSESQVHISNIRSGYIMRDNDLLARLDKGPRVMDRPSTIDNRPGRVRTLSRNEEAEGKVQATQWSARVGFMPNLPNDRSRRALEHSLFCMDG